MPLIVVQVLPALEGGGVERGTVEVARELVRRGHRAIVISAPGRLVGELEAAGVEHLPWAIGRKSPATARHLGPLRRLLRERRVDILHARSRLPAWVAYLAWQSLWPGSRTRFVTSVHGLHSVNRYSRIMTRGEAVIAISGTVRDYILENYPGLDPGRIRLIYRGVDPEVYRHGYDPPPAWRVAWERSMPWAGERILLTLPARISARKGHDDFLHLLAALKGRGLPVHGLIVGEADPGRPERLATLQDLAATLGVREQVSFLGHRSDVRELMAVSHLVFCLSKLPEAFGRTTLEALSLGVPVIGYAHGGVGEILARMFPEGAAPVGDRAALAHKTADFIWRPRQVPAATPFTLQAMLDETLSVYEGLAS